MNNPQSQTSLLSRITSPDVVKGLSASELSQLAAELRGRMVEVVSRTGGHLAPSLGTVELTLALCRVLALPQDKVVWDVGHQSYAWKMLTGRNDRMETLRRFGGLRGFPFPEESPYDAFIGGHAGVALSAALGMAAARDARGGTETIVAIVGDASLTNGVALEALNAVRHTTERLILVINDNGMSISRNVGAFARLFARQLSGLRYNRLRAAAECAGHRLRLGWLKDLYRALKAALKPLFLRQHAAIFEDLGLRYIGPIDGHNIEALSDALQSAIEGHVPIALHIATVKGQGYAPAVRNPSKWHGVAPWANPSTRPNRPTWSKVFGDTLCALAREDDRLVAITAAMRSGTGLTDFFRLFPTRAYDVGICEEHAVAFAAGLASAGRIPIVALYSTFAQRAIDNIMHEVCLQNLPVVICLDRAGIVGADGPTHHGLYDIAMLRTLPNLTFVAPTSEEELRAELAAATRRHGPTILRYSRGTAPAADPTALQAPTSPDRVPLLALGNTVAWLPSLTDLPVDVIPVHSIKPLPDFLPALLDRPLITLEDGAIAGGFGSAIAEQHRGPLLLLGWPDVFIPAGSDAELRAAYNLDPASLHNRIAAFLESLHA